MKKTIFLCALAFAMLLSSCGYLEGKGLLPVDPEAEPEQLEGEELETVNETIISKALSIGETFYDLPRGDKEEGALALTVTNAKIVHNFSQNGLSADNTYGMPYVVLDGFTYTYPDFLDENTEMMDGSSLLLVDVTIENIDAVRCEFPETNDPYLFRGDGFLCLCDLSRPDGGTKEDGQFVWASVKYFNLLNSEPIHPLAFRLEPGETIQVQIGFFLDDYWDNPNTLFLSNHAGQYSNSDDRCLFIDLNLSNGEKDT